MTFNFYSLKKAKVYLKVFLSVWSFANILKDFFTDQESLFENWLLIVCASIQPHDDWVFLHSIWFYKRL
jgi:hypothetical protein